MKRVKKQNDSIDSLNGDKEDNYPIKVNYIPPMPASAKGYYFNIVIKMFPGEAGGNFDDNTFLDP